MKLTTERSEIEAGARTLRDLLRRAVRVLGLLERHEVACCGVSLAQCYALCEVAARPGISVGELAERLGVDPSTASRTVEGLVRMGAVERVPVPGNRRAVALSVTAAGAAMLASLDARAEADARRVWEALPGERRAAILEAVDTLLDALERAYRRCAPVQDAEHPSPEGDEPDGSAGGQEGGS